MGGFAVHHKTCRFLSLLLVITVVLSIALTSASAAAPGDVLINEVAPSETGGYDWIEFYNASNSSIDIQNWVVKERNTTAKTFTSSYLMAPGEYIVLHFNQSLPDEITADANGNGYRDFYTTDTGLVATDNVIILEDGAGTIIDALAFANNDGTWASDQHSAFQRIVDANEWVATVYPNDTEENKRRNEKQCADWSEGGTGKSLGRDALSTDTNSKNDWHLFTSQTPGKGNPTIGTPGDILINEVAPSEAKDWIEFYNPSGKGINIEYWVAKERGTIVKTFPFYTVAPEEHFVLNFDGDPANDEIAGDTNGNGYCDFYTADSGLVGTDNVVILEDGASTMIDAVSFANNDGTWASSQQSAFNAIVNAGHWEGTPNGGAGINEPESADWSEGDEGESLGRDSSSTDTNTKADWHLFTGQTPGEPNPTLGVPGSVLINEVAPSEDKDWLEFYNTSGESIAIKYWVVKARTSVVKTFPYYTITPGEYIVLNFGGDPADDEMAGDTNGNGYRDFYTADSGLTGTDNVIILEDGAGTIIDVMAFANKDGTWAGAQQTAFNNIVNAGHWEGTPDGGAEVNEAESADWSKGDEGKSLGRDSPSSDTNSRADWHLLDYPTPGGINYLTSALIGRHIQLPRIDNEAGWSTWLQMQNVGITGTGVIVFFWGEYSGLCPSESPAPLGHTCWFIPEDGVWTLKAAIPPAARSAIAYSVREDKYEAACEEAGEVENSEEWREWVAEHPDKYPGEPLAVTVSRSGPNDFGTLVSSVYTGISERMAGESRPYGYFAPYAMRAYNGLDTEMAIQNSGRECTSVWIYYGQQGLAGFAYAQHIENLAPGEAIRVRVPAVLELNNAGPWLGSTHIVANEPLGIVVDQTSFAPGSYDRGTLLTHRASLWEEQGDTTLYADLLYRELGGWSAGIQVQNLSQNSLPTFVTVDFVDASGDEVLFLGDWVYCAGSRTFHLPAIIDLGFDFMGAAIIQSHDQVGYPGGRESAGEPIIAVVDLKRAGYPEGMAAQGGSYNAHSLSEKEWVWNIALPSLSKGYQDLTSLIALRNNSNCNRIELLLEFRDQTGGAVIEVDSFWLQPGQVRSIDLANVGSVALGWVGAGEVRVTEVEQLCDGEPDAPIIPSAVVVERGIGPGDVTRVYEGIPVNIP